MRDTSMTKFLCIILVRCVLSGVFLCKYKLLFCHPPKSRTIWQRNCCPTTEPTEQLLYSVTTSGRRQRPLISLWLTFRPRYVGNLVYWTQSFITLTFPSECISRDDILSCSCVTVTVYWKNRTEFKRQGVFVTCPSTSL